MKNSFITALLLLMFLASSVSASETGSTDFHQTFDVTPGGRLIVDTDCGTLRITGSQDNTVSVTVDIRGSEKDVAGFEVTAKQQENEVTVQGRREKHSSWFWNWSSRLKVVYTIQVPLQFALQLNTSGGNVIIKTIDGIVYGRTSGGNLDFSGIRGDVDFSTSGGNIRAENCLGKIYMKTSGGGITMTEITGDVDVRTSGGSIRADTVGGKLNAHTSGGNISLKVNGENHGIYAETSGGSITIEVPRDTGANVDAQTTGGDIRCNMPLMVTGTLNRGKITGTINNGGSLIHARTSGGNIRIIPVE